jgi:hypothetical protein
MKRFAKAKHEAFAYANIKVEKMRSIFSKSGKAAYKIQKRSFCTIMFSEGKCFIFCF